MLPLLTEIVNITSEVTLQNQQISNILAYFRNTPPNKSIKLREQSSRISKKNIFKNKYFNFKYNKQNIYDDSFDTSQSDVLASIYNSKKKSKKVKDVQSCKSLRKLSQCQTINVSKLKNSNKPANKFILQNKMPRFTSKQLNQSLSKTTRITPQNKYRLEITKKTPLKNKQINKKLVISTSKQISYRKSTQNSNTETIKLVKQYKNNIKTKKYLKL